MTPPTAPFRDPFTPTRGWRRWWRVFIWFPSAFPWWVRLYFTGEWELAWFLIRRWWAGR